MVHKQAVRYLEQFSNARAVFGCVQSGYFLEGKATLHPAFALQQLENRSIATAPRCGADQRVDSGFRAT
jgi:hypothetical protein